MMKKSIYFLIIILILWTGCAPNSPAHQYSAILNYVLNQLQGDAKNTQLVSQNIAKYIESNKAKILDLQEKLANYNDDLIYEQNDLVSYPTRQIISIVRGNQDYSQDENIVSALVLLKIIE